MKKFAIAGLIAVGALSLTGCGASEYEVIAKYTVPEHEDEGETDYEQPVLVGFSYNDPQSFDVDWDCYKEAKVGQTVSSTWLYECQHEYED